jgi:hypothetical protein
MPRMEVEEMIRRRVNEFNGLPPHKRIRRTQLLRELLNHEHVSMAVIYSHGCCMPTRKKLEARSTSSGEPRYLNVITSTGASKQGFVTINLPEVGTAFIELDRIPLKEITLAADELLPNTENASFLLKVTVKKAED